VYPNSELSQLATELAGDLAAGNRVEERTYRSTHPAAARVAAELASEWKKGKQLVAGEDFVFLKETGRYCSLHAGRANPKAWSLALECRNFQDGLSREILFQERLFVASRPRVFQRYHRILGLSGSIGSKPEQAFLRDTYRAAFFKVPPFLKTCRGSPFHEAVPVKLGRQGKAVFVEPTLEAQLARVAEVAFEARERVPVLVIARDRACADNMVERLRQVARSRGMGALCEDMIRSLSRTLYESNSEQWKENLNRSTLPLGDASAGCKSWRVTVADPRAARGTDYRVDDHSVDAHGGLLLLPTAVPTSRREWTQFLGRTARQDCRGQFCCVLFEEDYSVLSRKCSEHLPADGSTVAVETILRWGDREAEERIQNSAALYNCGLRMNELCEEVFAYQSHLLEQAEAREHLVEACQRFKWMSVREVNEAFRRLPNFEPARVPSKAQDLGRPLERVGALRRCSTADLHSRSVRSLSRGASSSLGSSYTPVSSPKGTPKVVVFCLDWSASMMSKDTGTPMSRFELCLARVQRIMREQVSDCDLVGVVVFGPDVQIVFPPTAKGHGGKVLEMRIAGLRPQTTGGTRFFDAVAQCLQLLMQSPPVEAKRWLICLTDGDDLGSHPQNARGEVVGRMLSSGALRHLNMVVITVGILKAINTQIVNSWAERVHAAGGVGKHLPERDAAAMDKAFDVVAECLAVEVDGAMEC